MPRRLTLLLSLLGASIVAGSSPNFEEHVLPIFEEHCNGCHNPDKFKADLDLTTYAGMLAGSSGGEVVKAGVPDTSLIYETISHAEDVEPMPPKKPKLPDREIELIHQWIAGGLIEAAGGKSKLREVAYDLAAGSSDRPEDPALPVGLPAVELARTGIRPPILALAASPWADLIAVSGHEQILLYGQEPAALESEGFEPIVTDAMVLQRDFDDEEEPGQVGNAWMVDDHRPLEEIPTDLLSKNGAFSFSAWIKPEEGSNNGTIFGRYNFTIFLEKTRGGWRARVMNRSVDNKIAFFGRSGEIPSGSWQHLAVTCDGKEWAFYYGGKEVVRQAIPDEHVGFHENDRPFFLAGDGHHADRRYRGGLDEIRVYRRALSSAEVADIFRNANPTMEHVGTLPFPEGDVHDLRFSRNGELIVAAGGRGSRSGKVALFDVRTGERRATIGGEQDIVLSADISADHRFVAIGTPAKKVKIFSTKDGKMLHSIDKHTEWVTAVRFSPDGRLLATGDRNGGIHVWESENAGIVYTLNEHKVRINGLSWRADGKVLASAAEDGKFVLWDMKDGWPMRTASPHAVKREPSRYSRQTGTLDIAFARDGRFVTAGRDRTVRWWSADGTSLGEVRELEA
ncbi:MAG: LamG-like jellyroll fold domain-containing protein, partial [Verrucomicrobiota bacterium]